MGPVSGQDAMTLKSKMGALQLQDFHAGDIVSGIIKCIDNFGVFVTLEHSNVVRFQGPITPILLQLYFVSFPLIFM